MISENDNYCSILTDHHLVDCIFNIIESSEKYCFIVTPFLKFEYWAQLTRRLKAASDNKKRVLFILSMPDDNNQWQDDEKMKKDMDNIEKIKQKLNKEYNFDLFFVKNLHTKIYLNESEILLSSMNLQEWAANNNHEIGCLIKNPEMVKKIVNDVIFKQILRGEKEYVEGRWSDWLKRGQFLDDNYGYCIKCKEPIPYNEGNPLCGKCNNNDVDSYDNFCHKCGEKYQNVSINYPLCHTCYDNTHRKNINGA
jgi:hypothetical protein